MYITADAPTPTPGFYRLGALCLCSSTLSTEPSLQPPPLGFQFTPVPSPPYLHSFPAAQPPPPLPMTPSNQPPAQQVLYLFALKVTSRTPTLLTLLAGPAMQCSNLPPAHPHSYPPLIFKPIHLLPIATLLPTSFPELYPPTAVTLRRLFVNPPTYPTPARH